MIRNKNDKVYTCSPPFFLREHSLNEKVKTYYKFGGGGGNSDMKSFPSYPKQKTTTWTEETDYKLYFVLIVTFPY